MTPADSASNTASASAGSSSSSRCSTDHRSSKATEDATSSSTSISGGRFGLDRVQRQDALREGVQGADRGAVDGVECLRRPQASVLPRSTGASVSVGSFDGSNATRSRSRSSAPAFSVNVTAAIRSSGIPSVRTRVSTRSTSEWVLPEPAPASTKMVESVSVRIRSLAGDVGQRRHAGPPPLVDGVCFDQRHQRSQRRVRTLALPALALSAVPKTVRVAEVALHPDEVGIFRCLRTGSGLPQWHRPGSR